MATPKTTHFVMFDEEGRRLARAMCGALVDRKAEHSNTPTCATCQAKQRDFEQLDLNDLGDLVLGEGGL